VKRQKTPIRNTMRHNEGKGTMSASEAKRFVDDVASTTTNSQSQAVQTISVA
jgi:polyhydroxyalkanoate synthesis regulator phasin